MKMTKPVGDDTFFSFELSEVIHVIRAENRKNHSLLKRMRWKYELSVCFSAQLSSVASLFF